MQYQQIKFLRIVYLKGNSIVQKLMQSLVLFICDQAKKIGLSCSAEPIMVILYSADGSPLTFLINGYYQEIFTLGVREVTYYNDGILTYKQYDVSGEAL